MYQAMFCPFFLRSVSGKMSIGVPEVNNKVTTDSDEDCEANTFEETYLRSVKKVQINNGETVITCKVKINNGETIIPNSQPIRTKVAVAAVRTNAMDTTAMNVNTKDLVATRTKAAENPRVIPAAPKAVDNIWLLVSYL